MNKTHSQSSQSIEEEGKVHKSDVIVIIKDWQLSIAFGHQKSQGNSQVQLLESDRGQKVEGRRHQEKEAPQEQRGMEFQGGRGTVVPVSRHRPPGPSTNGTCGSI